MDNISKYISELLFDHDCVIVPSLGGFLASNDHSKILYPNQVIYPPYRHIAFNVYLKQNDGLLANHIVESENVTYNDATRFIESFTALCFENLDNGKKVNIDEVGSLYYDKERNIQFEAFRNFNHLKDSFGMEAIHFLPVQREEVAEKKKKSKKIDRPSVKEKKERVILGRKGKRYLGVVIVASAIVLFSINLYMMAPKSYEASSLNPFDTQETIISQSDSMRNMPAPAITPNDTTTQQIVNTDTSHTPVETASIETTKTEIANTAIVNPPPVVTKPESIAPSPVENNSHYIIAGVFKIRDNAESLVTHLRQTGFANARLMEANNMNYVSYNAYPTWGEAQAAIDSLKDKNLAGWIWKH